MALQKGSAPAFVNVVRDDAPQLHAVVSAEVFRSSLSVLGCDPPVLTRVSERWASGLLASLNEIPEKVSFGHALVRLLQQELRGVGRRGRHERDDCVLRALVIRVWQ